MSDLYTLNWSPQFDEKSRAYGVAEVLPTDIRRNKQWKTGPILDQGKEGACVGFGWTAELLSTPVAINLSKLPYGIPQDPDKLALTVYKQAQLIDEFPGEDGGTSVIAGAKIMKQYGFLKEYRWAFTINDVINGLIHRGPVVLGIEWYSGMYKAPNGILSVTGKMVGGHCITAVGYRTAKTSAIPGEETIVLQNSWGNDWGINGLAQIKVTDLAKLLEAGGEACIPFTRSYAGTR